ncbi:flagellar biosynthesis protein FlhF [Fodinisporobacter ferrooxydans]|uniref:Flagellar biosynthesis protein FlhF n=1 Tax=Fodinisporobacter ferrooxydans TaxID=2901836 RepID=A0ABY4CJP0_9BACL|nr:flagellar biosynthesis protein FlhF [Alicyclobacillaceae bacterium MYW30-H2]
MLVKRYIVKEVPEALSQIRQDLGADAMILSTKKIQTKGFLGLFSRIKIEVIAAASDSFERATPKQSPQSVRVREDQAASPLKTQGIGTTTLLADKSDDLPNVGIRTYSRETLHENRMKMEEKKQQHTSISLQQTHEQDVMGELKALKKLVSRITETNQSQLPKPLLAIRQILLQQEILAERVNEMIANVLEEADQTWDLKTYRWKTEQILLDEMSVWTKDATIEASTRVAAFAGATGVGKTTTIAKIAAEQVLKYRKKIALITTDTYRIAAVEQLRTYANILNIPIEVAYTPDDYKKALQTFQTCDLILVDTAGRNYHEQKFIKEIQDFFAVERPQELYLVLSSTSKMADVQKMIQNFSDLEIDKYLFTKLDETTSYGAIYNVLRSQKKPFTYVTDGQNVPDDLSVLTHAKLANLLIGENSYV